MSNVNIYLIIALILVGVHVVASMLIVYRLQKRKYKINFFLLRMMIIKYANDYKKITTAEQGYPDRLYHVYVYSIMLALLFGLLGALTLLQ